MPRGNVENLKSNSESTPEERKKRASKAGKASGVSRRKKMEAKETAKMILQLAATSPLDQYLEGLGVKEQNRTNQTGIIARHIVLAQSGNEKSARLVFELSGDISKQGGEMNVHIGNGDDGVIVYLPEVEKLEGDDL